jgi:hypothetical protein
MSMFWKAAPRATKEDGEMVIKRDFLSHWKVKAFAFRLAAVMPEVPDNLRGSFAITLLVRLWFHCETSKVWRFKKMTPEILAGVCEWPYEPPWLWKTLQDCGLIELNGESLVVHDWQVHNASLVASWKRGKFGAQGGRPKNPPGLEAETSKVKGQNHQGSPQKPSKVREGKLSSTPPDSQGESGPPAAQFLLDSSLEIKGKRGLPPSIEEMIEDAKSRYEDDDVEKALCRYEDWRKTPKGRGKRLTPLRWYRFLRDCRPKKEEGAHYDNGIEPEVAGWRNLMSEANPELNLPALWGELTPQGRAWARELARDKEKTVTHE